MKNVMSMVLVVFVAWCWSMTVVHADLLPNGNFEFEEEGRLAGWKGESVLPTEIPNNIHGVDGGYEEIVWDTQSVGDGRGSLLIRSKGIYNKLSLDGSTSSILITPKFPVQPDTEYRLTYYYRAQGLQPAAKEYCRATMSLRAYVGGKNEGYPVATDYLHRKDYEDRFLKEESFREESDSAAWKKVERRFKTPAEATAMSLRLFTSSNLRDRKYFFAIDHISWEPVEGGHATATQSAAWKPRQLPPRSERGLETGEVNLLPPAVPFGSRIQRTMKLLATSTPEHRNRVHILVYGQSIVTDGTGQKMRLLIDELRAKYPHADIVYENAALGGFMSNLLKETAETDLYPAYPDLVILHDYSGGKSRDERRANTETIYANLRRRTTSEMITLTHHLSFPGLIQDRPPGATYMASKKGQDEDSELIRSLADKYGYEVAEVRKNWEKYIADTAPGKDERMEVFKYLQDQVHQNPRGGMLMERIVRGNFQYRPDQEPTWLNMVKVYTPDGKRWSEGKEMYPSGGILLDQPLRLELEGNRIVLLAMPVPGGKPGSAKVLIDGKPPTTIPEIYTATRTTITKPSGRWPYIYRVGLNDNPVAEEWTLTFTKVTPKKAPDGKSDDFDLEFEVRGSVTGPDGTGKADEKFVSKSGRITLEPEWFLKAFHLKAAKAIPTVGFEVKWQVRPMGMDVWQPAANVDPATEDRYVLAQGLPNTKHTLEVIPNGDGPVGLRAIVVHQPSVPPLDSTTTQPSTSPR